MEAINQNLDNQKEWDDFCLQSDDSWICHTTKWLDHLKHYNPELNSESKSFFVKENGKTMAICPLLLENNYGIKQFSFAGGFGQLPALANGLSFKEKEKLTKFIFNQIDELAKINQVALIKMRYSVLSPSFIEKRELKFNMLMQFGFIDTSLNTRVIDLNKSLTELRREVRHGHDAAIDQASKMIEIKIFTKENITKDIFEAYVKMHIGEVKSRMARPRIVFDLMFEILKDGNAFLIGAKKDDKFIGFSYFNIYKDNANYTSACHLPDFDSLPIGHLIQWAAIKYLKENGGKHYEIGWQFFANTLTDFPTTKELNISKFKRGFGGYTITQYMGEKYYDKKLFTAQYEKRISAYADGL